VIIIVLLVIAGIWYWNQAVDQTPLNLLNTTADVTLEVGQTDTVWDLAITFNRVVEDSRCPADVACIQTGQFVGEFIFAPADEVPTVHLLSFGGTTETETLIGPY